MSKLFHPGIASSFHRAMRQTRDRDGAFEASERRLLVVDDEDEIRASICDCLRALGFETVQAENGQSGLLRLAGQPERAPIHGVLLDLQMPVLGGMAVLQELRQRHATLPVIVMSEVEELGIVREAMKLGAQEYLVKPFEFELLKTKCLRVFPG